MRVTAKRPRIPVPTEHREQAALIAWAEARAHTVPELALLHAVPNGGKRNVITAKLLKAEGVKAGVPDLFLPVARTSGYGVPHHGLFIEMKRRSCGAVSGEQEWWIARLRNAGYRVEVCWGWDEARAVLCDYLGIGA